LMRKPLDNRLRALFRPMFVACRFDCALADAMFVTTEKDAIGF
jgi:hypothetical protein